MRRSSFISSTIYFNQTDQTTLPSQTKTIQIPISSSPQPELLSLPPATEAAAIKIQSRYRAHLIHTLYKTISTVNSQASLLEHQIQQQDTVDAIRRDERERVRVQEALMALLLRLDSVPGGLDAAVREARRKVSRRIVGLQEIVDALGNPRAEGMEELMGRWEEDVAEMEGEAWWGRDRCRCRRSEEKREMERFCVEKLGFRCMERFLHDV